MPAFSAVDCIEAWSDHLHAYPPEGLSSPDHKDLEQLVSAARALADHVDRQIVRRLGSSVLTSDLLALQIAARKDRWDEMIDAVQGR